jgi:uncharacterized lipoprotein YmbA
VKSRRAFSFRLAFTVALSIMLGGCFGGSRSIVPDYYLLTARTADAQPPNNAGNVSIGVGPVRVAPFLARQQIVTHAGNSSLNILPQRWGEPLEQGIQRVLLQNLATLTGVQSRGFPWRQNTTPDYALRIDVIDLDRLNDKTALLDVGWVLEDLKNHRVITTQQTHLTTAINGDDATALVDAFSDLWEQLAQRAAQALPVEKRFPK